jgi:hypothetical protein
MVVAALMVMLVTLAAGGAFGQPLVASGPATGVQAVDAEHAGNVCVQQVQNVNSGNVDIDQAAAIINEQIGKLQTQTVNQSINQNAEGIEQVNNAIQICEQALNQPPGEEPPPKAKAKAGK